jgi:flagellar hook-basal body complex protein FliE
MTTPPVEAIGAVTAADPTLLGPAASASPASSVDAFARMLADGVSHVNQKVLDAEKLSTQFALDDSVPAHQVTFALQEARMSMEFMLQVRNRLVEAYQQFANMQL